MELDIVGSLTADNNRLNEEVARLKEIMATLYRRVEVVDGETAEPVQFVGNYVLRYGKEREPTVAFVEWRDDTEPTDG